MPADIQEAAGNTYSLRAGNRHQPRRKGSFPGDEFLKRITYQ